MQNNTCLKWKETCDMDFINILLSVYFVLAELKCLYIQKEKKRRCCSRSRHLALVIFIHEGAHIKVWKRSGLERDLHRSLFFTIPHCWAAVERVNPELHSLKMKGEARLEGLLFFSKSWSFTELSSGGFFSLVQNFWSTLKSQVYGRIVKHGQNYARSLYTVSEEFLTFKTEAH